MRLRRLKKTIRLESMVVWEIGMCKVPTVEEQG